MAIRTSHPYGANQRISGGSTLGIGVEARRAGARTGRTDPGVSAQWNIGPHTTGPMFHRSGPVRSGTVRDRPGPSGTVRDRPGPSGTGPRLSRVFLLRLVWLFSGGRFVGRRGGI